MKRVLCIDAAPSFRWRLLYKGYAGMKKLQEGKEYTVRKEVEVAGHHGYLLHGIYNIFNTKHSGIKDISYSQRRFVVLSEEPVITEQKPEEVLV